jgi:hypothetical protein
MNFEDSVVKLNVKSRIIDYNHPNNIFNIESFTGTGFFITDKLILTCYHVVENAINIEILYKQTIHIIGTIKHIFPDDDLAVVELENSVKDAKILEFKIIDTRHNEEVLTVGFPLDSTTIKITKGIISGYQESLIQTDAALNHGNSGGPLIIQDGKSYKIIGVNVSKMSGTITKTGYVVPIYRFIILQKKLNLNNYLNSLVIQKPCIYWDFQCLIQDKLKKFLFNKKPELLKKNIGIRFTIINTNYYLAKYIKIDEVLLSINSIPVDNLGNIKFNFFPEKISINDIGLWFVSGDELEFEIYNPENGITRIIKIKLEIIKTNLRRYFYLDNYPKSFVENNGLILSIFTKDHMDNIKDLHITTSNLIKFLNRFLQQKDLFTVYLVDLDYLKINSKFIKYPIGEIILEINGKQFNNLEEFTEVIKEQIIYFKTLDNEIFFV